jgi:hypothetical protein
VGNGHDDLVEVGRLLFGERWQSDLARALGTSSRMVRYWVAGTHARPEDLRQRLAGLLQERVDNMKGMIVRLRTIEQGETSTC